MLWFRGDTYDLDPNRVYASSEALAVNNYHHDIVGYAVSNEDQREYAIRFDVNVQRLEDSVVNRDDWQLLRATAVADDGRIAGVGRRSDGRHHAFLLTPTGK